MDYSKIKIFKVTEPVAVPVKKVVPLPDALPEKLDSVAISAEKTDFSKKLLEIKNKENKLSNELVSLTMSEELALYELGLDAKIKKGEQKSLAAKIRNEFADKRRAIQETIWKHKATRRDIIEEMKFMDLNGRKRSIEEKNKGMKKVKDFVLKTNPVKMVQQRASIKTQIYKVQRMLREGKRNYAPFEKLTDEDKTYYQALILEYTKNLQVVEEALNKQLTV